MKITFVSHSTIEFDDESIVEGFVKSLPIAPRHQQRILRGEVHTDESDQSGFPGAGKTIHTFSIKKEEE